MWVRWMFKDTCKTTFLNLIFYEGEGPCNKLISQGRLTLLHLENLALILNLSLPVLCENILIQNLPTSANEIIPSSFIAWRNVKNYLIIFLSLILILIMSVIKDKGEQLHME